MHSCRELMAVADVRASVKLFVAAFSSFAEVNRAVSETDGDAEGKNPFWAEPGNGWGMKTASSNPSSPPARALAFGGS
jgi:hypothetical protein